MVCIHCEIGKLKPGKTNITLNRGNQIVIVQDVPALICANCKESYLDSDVTSQAYELVEQKLKLGESIITIAFEVLEPTVV